MESGVNMKVKKQKITNLDAHLGNRHKNNVQDTQLVLPLKLPHHHQELFGYQWINWSQCRMM